MGLIWLGIVIFFFFLCELIWLEKVSFSTKYQWLRGKNLGPSLIKELRWETLYEEY